MKRHAVILAGLAGVLSIAAAGEVGAPVEAAPQAKDTRNQTWASAAWSEGAKCWLVVWREGYLSEQKSDIWCARISGEGKPLDPAGAKLTSGDALRDRPRVASDGKRFLVVWEEMPTGKDWDTYAALVPADGDSLEGKPLLLAGGEHNQCRPDVAFAKGNYHVLYMEYRNGAYGICGKRVSPEGKALSEQPVEVATVPPTGTWYGHSPELGKNPVNVTLPVIAANAEGDLLSAFLVRDGFRVTYLARRPIDAATGQPGGAAPTGKADPSSPGGKGRGGTERMTALAMGPEGAISVSSTEASRSKNDIVVGRLSKTGEVLGLQEAGAGALGIDDAFKPIAARHGVAFTGKEYLAVGEVVCPAEKRKNGPPTEFYARVIGWRIKSDGNVEGEPFAVAGEVGRECVLPSIASGPDGLCLAVCSEIRGADDVKVVARVLKVPAE